MGLAFGFVILGCAFVADAFYARRATQRGQDPGDNALAHWLKAHPVLAWGVALLAIASFSWLVSQ